MSVLFSALIEDTHLAISGNNRLSSELDETLITAWLRKAILDYSSHFPKTAVSTISTSSGTKVYALPADFLFMHTAEYPTGDDPPTYLMSMEYQDAEFFNQDDAFGIIRNNDEENPDDLILSFDPADSGTVTIRYAARHDNTISAGTNLTVPEKHHHILIQYSRWQAWIARRERIARKVEEGKLSPDVLQRTSTNVFFARSDYDKLIGDEVKKTVPTSAVVSWRGPNDLKQIY